MYKQAAMPEFARVCSRWRTPDEGRDVVRASANRRWHRWIAVVWSISFPPTMLANLPTHFCDFGHFELASVELDRTSS